MLDFVYDLGKVCGELAITTDTPLTSLHDTDSTVNIDDLMKVTEDNGDIFLSRVGCYPKWLMRTLCGLNLVMLFYL